MFFHKAKIANLEAKIKELESDRDRWREQAGKYQGELQEQIQAKMVEANKAEAIHREQTEADLVFVSLKIIQRMLSGEKKDSLLNDILKQQELNYQLGRMQRGETILGLLG